MSAQDLDYWIQQENENWASSTLPNESCSYPDIPQPLTKRSARFTHGCSFHVGVNDRLHVFTEVAADLRRLGYQVSGG